jgi:uncharacterized membrane protein
MLVPLVLITFFLTLGYASQIYLAKKEEKLSLSVEEKVTSTRSSTDSFGRGDAPHRLSWGSSNGHRIEKAE